ncbi:branched-chain amino acid ABC transporter permease [Rhizobacter sp. Root404]|uniref:branched-chain amino acid ABC transporter permease n=1 Tax=Rhizobacter sp. Root404 TaxID=1736528 RepID=UPI0006F338CC|nr:branched-chain amino acid ABC transporter permease [Rhizobacter sp. Root404]KQW38394.1 amino acid ABC transporter [Rhizobacter sp. Root404]
MDQLSNFWAIYSNLILAIGTNALLALSIYVTLSCGMLAMANAAFMGIGAYVSAYSTMRFGAPFPASVALGVLAPALVALVMGRPTLKLSGVYLAMATLAFGEVVRVCIINAESITGGALGLNGIPALTQWWHVALGLAVTVFALRRLATSRVGRAFASIQQDEVASGLMGVNVVGHKLVAFVIGAAIAGLAGALNAHLTFFIGPQEFGFERGVEILTMAVLGGITSPLAPIVGALTITILPELLRSFEGFRLAMNGLILIFVTVFLPQGILGTIRGITRARAR